MEKRESNDSNSAYNQKAPATVFSYLRYHGGIQPRERTRRIFLCHLRIERRYLEGYLQIIVFDQLPSCWIVAPQLSVGKLIEMVAY